MCIPRRPRCVLVVARVARRFRTPRMSSSRTSLHRVRIIIIVKKESQQQTGGKKMLIGTSTTTSSKRDDASSRRREKREFFCWTRCSTNWTVTVRCSILPTRRVYRFSSSSHKTRCSMRGGTCRPLFFPLEKKESSIQKLTIFFFTSILFYYYYYYMYYCYYYYSELTAATTMMMMMMMMMMMIGIVSIIIDTIG